MPVASIVGLFFVLSMSGCAGLGSPPASAPTESSSPPAQADVVAPAVPQPPLPSAPPSSVAPPVVPQPPQPSAPPSTVAPPAGIVAPKSAATPSTAAPPGKTASRTAPPIAKPPAKTPSPASAAPSSKKESIQPDSAKPQAPPLDLAALEQRLKDTKAIGVLTKITLKNQVDDLLNQFRAFYQGKLKVGLADLRRSYDLLVLKVLSLLQDNDQALATAITASREAIWGILSDPAKFATI